MLIVKTQRQCVQVGFFKKNPRERSAAATVVTDDDDVSQWAIYYFV